MKNNFNLKKFLTENKLTPLSKQLNESRGDLEDIIEIIKSRSAETEFSEVAEAEEIIRAIKDYYGIENNLSEQENNGSRIYNFSMSRGQFDVWKERGLTMADLRDSDEEIIPLDTDLDFAEFYIAGDEGGFLVILNQGEGKQYDKNPSNWTEEQYETLERAIDDVY